MEEVQQTNLLSKWMAKYSNWVYRHSSLARNLENVLYMAPHFLPDRFGDTEIKSEATYSMVGLLKLYHDYILSGNGRNWQLSQTDKFSNAIRGSLTVLSHGQLTVEAITRKYSDAETLLNQNLAVEVFKFVCRIYLLIRYQGKMLYQGGQFLSSYSSKKGPKREELTEAAFTGSRSGKTYRRKRFDGNTDTGRNTNELICFPDATITTGQEGITQFSAEFLHILRPLLYICARKKYGVNSWLPLLLSAFVELSGLHCSYVTRNKIESRNECVPPEIKEELSRRKMFLIFYLLRSPLFELFTKPAAIKVEGATQNVPLIGRLIGFALNSGLFYYQKYHSFTSRS